MNALIRAQTALAAAVNADPVLRLAHVAAWLDPVGADETIWECDADGDPAALVRVALQVTRRVFPDLYTDLLLMLRRGGGYTAVDRLVCTELTRRGIPLDDLTWLTWGVPIPAYGVDLTDPDFYRMYPEAETVVACFGVQPIGDSAVIDVPEALYTVAPVLAESLRTQPDPDWQSVADLLDWLSGTSGNSAIALTYDDMACMEPLGWTREEVAFGIEIITEAEAILTAAHAALDWLATHADARHTLQTNIQKLYQQKGDPHDHPQLAWPGASGHAERGTVPEPAVLQLRNDAA